LSDSIISRLVCPQSEHATKYWAQNISALDTLLSTSFEHISQNALYRISDKLLLYKEQIESYLAQKQRDLFSLKDTILLYDLTNTYFEGLALAPHTHVFEGNVSEPKTLYDILEFISDNLNKPTIAIDAGIATKDNIELIKQKGFDYICVARNKNSFKDLDFQEEKLLDDQTLSLYKTDEEAVLYVQSKKRQIKEQSMKSKAKTAFEEKLKSIIKRLKSYDKALEQISRLKEKYSLVSRFYTIDIKQENNKVKSAEQI